jgi:hypothetical protein
VGEEVSARLVISAALAASCLMASPARAQIGSCYTPVSRNNIWQQGNYAEGSTASVGTVRNFDMCPWESEVEAWQGTPPCGGVMTARSPTSAYVTWNCGGTYGERSQSVGKHWLIQFWIHWVYLGMTEAEVVLQRAPDRCRPGAGSIAPRDCGDEGCDPDGSRQQACESDGGQWDAAACVCDYPPECDSGDRDACDQRCGSWNPSTCECFGGVGEDERSQCEQDGCNWDDGSCTCDCGTRPSLRKAPRRRTLTPAEAFARALAGR